MSNVTASSRGSVERYSAGQIQAALETDRDDEVPRELVDAADYDKLKFDTDVAIDNLRARVLELEDQLRTALSGRAGE